MIGDFDVVQLLLMLIPLLFSVTLHEVAHGYAAYKMGDNTAMMAGRLTLNPLKHLDFTGSFLLPFILKISGAPFLFGYAKPVPVNFNNLHDHKRAVIFVASAGVVVNLILAVFSALMFRGLNLIEPLWHETIFSSLFSLFSVMLFYSTVINCVLAVFNTIPIPPLDGSRVLAIFLPRNLRIKYMQIERFGMLIIIVLLISNVLNKILTFFLNPMLKLLLGM